MSFLSRVCFLILFVASVSNAERNRLSWFNSFEVRVDGINPTCFPRPRCKEFDVIGAVVSVDKSLPYMGSNYCCVTFNMLRLSDYETEGKLMARILNSTVLEGRDYISIFDSEFNLVKNLTEYTENPYEIIYIDTPQASVEIYKDHNHRSKFEIVFTTYYEPQSPLCSKSSLFHRCGPTNKSICIDEELTCDKFEHCPNDSDEELCGPINETTINYDKMTVSIVLGFLITVIVATIFSILLLCFFKSNTKLSRAFMSIFGNRSSPNTKFIMDTNSKADQRCALLNENERSKINYHV